MADTNRDPIIGDFFGVFNRTGLHYGDAGYLTSDVFCAQAGSSPNFTRPIVGIASAAGGVGPQFKGTTQVGDLFTQVFTSFNHPTVTFQSSCYSDDQNTIIVPMILHTGNHRALWFVGNNYYSKPLSDIEPVGKGSDVPACAVFTFNPDITGDYKVVRLGIYMDRWQMAVDLWPGTPQPKYAHRPFPTP